MNWKEEVINLIEASFKSKHIQYKPKTAGFSIEKKVQRYLVDFMNLELKLIKPLARQVFISKELKSRRLPPERKRALNYIANKVVKGIDITYHQSKKVLDPTYNDLLLNNWIIHHLHLSDTKTQKGQVFYDRDKYVLLALFGTGQAFFIDARAHGKNEPYLFRKKELLEIVDNNWPQILKPHVHPDAALLNNDYTDEERDTLWEKGYSTSTTLINGKIIINPGIGTTSSGHNLHVVKRANEVIRFLQESLMEIDKDEEGMKIALGDEAGYEIKNLDISIQQLNEWPFFRVYERNSKLYIYKKY